MKDGCGCIGKPQKEDTSLDLELKNAVARGKRERQAVLKRVSQQRALVLRRMTAKYGR
jgi:hypothetical protein